MQYILAQITKFAPLKEERQYQVEGNLELVFNCREEDRGEVQKMWQRCKFFSNKAVLERLPFSGVTELTLDNLRFFEKHGWVFKPCDEIKDLQILADINFRKIEEIERRHRLSELAEEERKIVQRMEEVRSRVFTQTRDEHHFGFGKDYSDAIARLKIPYYCRMTSCGNNRWIIPSMMWEGDTLVLLPPEDRKGFWIGKGGSVVKYWQQKLGIKILVR